MLGRTHVIGSLALMHAGLLGYSVYANRNEASTENEGGYATVFGLPIGEPLSLIEYGLMVGAVGFFIMLLLRIGGSRLRIAQLVLMMGGLAALYFVADGDYPLTITFMLLCFALGTVFPDIDSETSTIGKYIKPISRAIPHRTITHTFWVVGLIAGLAWYFESVYLFALALGCAVHIAEDSFSQQGIQWFYPIPKLEFKRWKFPFAYETGGFGETILFYAAIAIHVLCAGYVIWASSGIQTLAM